MPGPAIRNAMLNKSRAAMASLGAETDSALPRELAEGAFALAAGVPLVNIAGEAVPLDSLDLPGMVHSIYDAYRWMCHRYGGER